MTLVNPLTPEERKHFEDKMNSAGTDGEWIKAPRKKRSGKSGKKK